MVYESWGSIMDRAREYVKEYLNNGRVQAKAYAKVHPNADPKFAAGNATNYHRSEGVRTAFKELLADDVLSAKDLLEIKLKSIADKIANATLPEEMFLKQCEEERKTWMDIGKAIGIFSEGTNIVNLQSNKVDSPTDEDRKALLEEYRRSLPRSN